MSYDEELISKSESRIIQETVINAFVSFKRFTVVDREKIKELEKEKSLQRTETFLDSPDSFTDGLSKKANYIVDESILSVRNSETKGKWPSTINIQITMLDVSTGEIMATESVNSEFVPHSEIAKKTMNYKDEGYIA